MALELSAILKQFPQLEVLARSLYWRSAFIRRILQRQKRSARRGSPPPVAISSPSPGLDDLARELRALGVAQGDI
ncbi:hypothetical protein WP12_12905 [Sphingomonas sp. SRS2]|nr:hypothetical protein WP12_12905 [Sphingomonas sp. SRS2]